jgi:PAP_fibrillin
MTSHLLPLLCLPGTMLGGSLVYIAFSYFAFPVICIHGLLIGLSSPSATLIRPRPIVKEKTSYHCLSSTNRAAVNGDAFFVKSNGYDESSAMQADRNSMADSDSERRMELIKGILQLGASYDRGFAATSRAKDQASTIISKLSVLNPEINASKGIDGYEGNFDDSPLLGCWRMIWTSAVDVLVLGANPIVSPGAIYQVFRPPIVTNVIDLLPRQQNLLPTNQLVQAESLLRAKVQTRASSRRNQPMQIGLVFESVELEPIEFLGIDVAFLRPFVFDLPKLPFVTGYSESDESRGYFDVLFLDNELLIIRQTSGGVFVLSRVDNFDP